MRSYFEFMSHEEVLIRGQHWHTPDTEPKAVVVIAHGMAEHILRYDTFAEFLLANQIFVYGHSHRGHGETVTSLDALGYIGTDGWNRMADDLETVLQIARKAYPNKPLIIFGHSMGSYVTRGWMTRSFATVDGVILSGTGFPSKVELEGGQLIAKLELLFKGKDVPSKRLDKLSFGKFNKGVQNPKTPFDWLSRDEVMVKEYIDSPFCGQIHPSSFFRDMSAGLISTLYSTHHTFNPVYPLYIISGEADPVGGYVKGVMKTASYYKTAGFKVTTKLFPEGRHEMLNEINRQDVYQSILKWINEVVKKG
jgi:alpha-beta hydrolase superfamily lysophospholipase